MKRCPHGHKCYPAKGLTCMVKAGWFWCAKCGDAGMYYPPHRVS